MFRSSTLPLASLAETCRILRHSLGAGLLVRDVFRQLSERGPPAVRPIAERIASHLTRGHSLEDALRPEAAAFPPVFVALVALGERTGRLPEVLADLEKFFDLERQLRSRFLAQMAWPAFQFGAAVFIIALLIWLTGVVALMSGGKPFDPLGIGLTGGRGAIIFLFLVFAALGALAGAYLLAMQKLRHKAAADAFLLTLPAVGPCLRAFALARFCLGLRLTLEAGMPIADSLGFAAQATGNAAFEETGPEMQAVVRRGDDITTALASDQFPPEFREAVAVGENSGRLLDILRRQAEFWQEEAGRRLALLAGAASYGVWILVGLLIVVLIFRIFSSYLNMIHQLSG